MNSDHIILLGNGPSLADFDLKSFGSFPTIGMNAAYRFWDQIGWYPTYYACLDDVVVVSHQEQIRGMVMEGRCKAFFLHQAILKTYPEFAEHPNVFILSAFLDGTPYIDTRKRGVAPLDFTAIRSFRTQKVTTGVMAARFAAYLGYRKIMLLGVDANYVQVVEGASHRDGIVLEMDRTPAHNPNYFFADYQQAGDRYNLPTPPTFDGNMHLQVFVDAVIDLANLKKPVHMFVGTTKSELHRQNVMPYVDPDAFIRAGRASRKIISVPDKSAPQPDYVPCAEDDLVFTRMGMWGGVRQEGPDFWTWPDTLDRNNAVSFMFERRVNARAGCSDTIGPDEGVSVEAYLSSPELLAVRVRLCAYTDGRFEGEEQTVTVGPKLQRVQVRRRFAHPHPSIRLDVSLTAAGQVQVNRVTAREAGDVQESAKPALRSSGIVMWTWARVTNRRWMADKILRICEKIPVLRSLVTRS